MKMWNGCLEATPRKGCQGGDLANLVAKGRDRGSCKLLGDIRVSVVRVLENFMDCRRMSTLVFVNQESFTQADEAQSSRVPPFEDPIDTKTPESPLAIALPVPLSESTPHVLVPILRRTARMAVCVPHAMSSGLSTGMAEVAGMSKFAFCKRFQSSYESSPSMSPPDLPSRKRYHGTSELVEDKEDDDEEDEEIEESMDSNSVSEDAEDEGPTVEDEDPAAGDEGLTTGVKGPGIDDEGYGLYDESRDIDDGGRSVESDGLGLEEEEEAVPGGQQQAASVIGTTVSAPLGLGYGALRRRELALEEGDVYSTFEVGQGSRSALESERPERVSAFRQPTLTTRIDPEDGMIYIDIPDYPPPAPPIQTPPLPEWTSGSLPISPSHSDISSPISSHMVPLTIPLTVPSLIATPAAVETEGFLIELGAQVEMHGGEIFSQRYQFRSLEYEQERVAVTFRAIWRLVLALEAWAARRIPKEQLCGMSSVMCRERAEIYGYSLLRRDVHD
ncbi:hypothetical protein Tco_0098108 [Tanacetum coccineum]